jgi:predicted ATP-dependent endonuclease of OLD family
MNILVGPNNSGKSTLISAFRALEVALRRAQVKNPEVVEGPKEPILGYRIPSESLPISIENVHTDYEEADTSVRFRLSNGNKLQLYFPKDGGCILIAEPIKKLVKTASAFREAYPIHIVVVPVLGPVEHNENVVERETVLRNLGTHRASRNFRNFWHHFPEGFDEFADLIASSWPTMTIELPEFNFASRELTMYCREERITRELYWAGSGFQVWCQLLTQLRRARDASLVVVDEPEVYLHPDIQRQLLSMLRAATCDTLLATHSTEIISEADPSEIVVVEKKRRSARRLRDIEGVQDVLELIGSVQNIALTRLAKHRKVLFMEGVTDFALLRKFARRIGLTELASGADLTSVESGGFSSWEKIISMDWGIEKALGQSLNLAVVYDRDYCSEEEINHILERLRPHVLFAHVHERKELENYLLIPLALQRALQTAVNDRARRDGREAEEPEQIERVLERITAAQKTAVQSQYLAKRSNFFRRSGVDDVTTTADTLKWFDTIWGSLDGRLKIVPGKHTLRLLREELQQRYSISLTDHAIIAALRTDEMAHDLSRLLRNLDEFRLNAREEKR